MDQLWEKEYVDYKNRTQFKQFLEFSYESKDKILREMEEKNFGIQKNHVSFHIWIVKGLSLLPVKKQQYGVFFDGECYVIYSASVKETSNDPQIEQRPIRGSILETFVHVWVGENAIPDAAAVAYQKVSEICEYLNNKLVVYRDTQFNESPRFKSYFKKCSLKYLKGYHRTTNQILEKNKLYKIDGKSTSIFIEKETISWSYFTSNDIFILLLEQCIFIWIGLKSKISNRIYAISAVLKITSCPNEIIFVDDGYEQSLNSREKQIFELYLPLKKRQVLPQNFNDKLLLKKFEINEPRLYICAYSSYERKFTFENIHLDKPISQTYLNSNYIYIFDQINTIWIWCGKRSNKSEQNDIISNVRGYIKKKQYSSTTLLIKIFENYEPNEFKVLFPSWNNKEIHSLKVKKFKLMVTSLNSESLYERPDVSAEFQLLDDGTGNLKIFNIHMDELLEMNFFKSYYFFSGNCYLVLYNYSSPVGTKFINYYWIGKTASSDDEKILLKHFNKYYLETPTICVLVREGSEPSHFLQLFNGKLIIFNDHATAIDRFGYSIKPTTYLIQVFGSIGYNTKAIEVKISSSSLNSNYCFILKTSTKYFVWCGKYTNGDEREAAKQIAGVQYTLEIEGHESQKFWDSIGGQRNYSIDLNKTENVLDFFIPRLFQCYLNHNEFIYDEIINFSQCDLNSGCMLLMDIGKSIYIWLGDESINDNRIGITVIVKEYLKKCPSFRDKNTCIIIIKQNYEPPTFIGFFPEWNLDYWKDQKTYINLRYQIEYDSKTENDFLNRKDLDANQIHFDTYPKYPIGYLTKPIDQLPPDVNPVKKEMHLTNDDFQKFFKMKYSEFYKLPQWKQQSLKKPLGLF